MRAKIDAWVWLHKADLGKTVVESLKHALTLVPTGSDKYGFGERQPLAVYTEDADWIGIPRHYAWTRYRDAVLGATTDISDGVPVDLQFQGTLRDNQHQFVADALSVLRDQSSPYRGLIGKAPPGTGKTTMALYVAAQLGQATMVVVHQEFLMTQWRDRAKQFLGLKDSEIGYVQQDTCEFVGKKLVIGMIHSLAERRYPDAFYKYFGLTIFDETHRLGAETWSRAAALFNSRARFSLTATPTRADGMDPVFFWHVGEIGASIKNADLIPTVYRVSYPIYVDMAQVKMWNGKINLARLVNFLTRAKRRSEFIASQVKEAVKKGRKVLVLSDRLEHLRTIYAMLLDRGVTSVGYYIGGTKEKARKKAASKKVILATFQYAKEGMDLPALDTLVLASPKTSVEQSIGRIQRLFDGKKDPVVVDIIDTVTVCRAFANKRLRLYKERGFDVVDVEIKDSVEIA